MILVDTNLLLYAYDSSSAFHEGARGWVESAFSGTATVLLPWMVVLAFLRITTHARALACPLSASEARDIVDSWFEQPAVRLAEPTERHWDILRALLVDAHVHGPLVTDAHLAALAIEQGATLCTNDRDFTRFPGLAVEFPLQ